ncbi:E3 ubiquitin-protein ligase SPL2-like isoform X1 [Cornus florida]|uniref:E3 ubiquitin-protein ligase SPL2-like isoform X1 n=1 Tax=Cornus florida TaxID=4283 RepID=UPI00289F2942|nr:E3 ubiquitin-protein ligase SPL2-like isoform X1 [Cornus florida]
MSDCAVMAGVFGVGTGLIAWIAHRASVNNSETLEKVRSIPTVRISDLRSILPNGHRSKRVFVRGVVQPKPSDSQKANPNVLHSAETGQEAIVVKRRQTCIYKEKVIKEEKKQDSDLKPTTKEETREWEETVSSTYRKVPFILAEGVRRPCSDYVIVDTDDLQHYLPLTKVYSHRSRLYHHKSSNVDVKADMLTEERIFPVGEVINAVGACSLENGVPVIRPCNTLPKFLTYYSKDSLVKELSDSVESSIATSGIFKGLSTCLLSYAAADFLYHKFYEYMQKKRDK